MAVVHDMTAQGRLLALLEQCKMHAARGEFRHMPGLLALTDQCDRAVRAQIRLQMDAKQIDARAPTPSQPSELPA